VVGCETWCLNPYPQHSVQAVLFFQPCFLSLKTNTHSIKTLLTPHAYWHSFTNTFICKILTRANNRLTSHQISHGTDFPSSLHIQISSSTRLALSMGCKQMKMASFICTRVPFELDGFCATGIDDQRARDLPSVLYSHELPNHIPSRPDLEFQCQRNFPTIWGYCYTGSSPIEGNLIAFQVHWHSAVTLSWLIIFLQLHFIEA